MGHGWKWQVIALVVKPTHVHLIPRPLPALPDQYFSLEEILHDVKKGSSLVINRHRGRLWEAENYDHIIRSDDELQATFSYLLQNAAEESPEGDPYSYDGLWCESQGSPEWLAPPPRQTPVPARPVYPRIGAGEFVRRRRRLPHQQLPGATYHVVISLFGYRPEEQAWPGAA